MRRRTLLVVALIALTGCSSANLHTVERKTFLSQDKKNVAIHLDAQQRLVLYNAKRFCAEPSPDALQAYAASLGLGGSTIEKSAASLAVAQQSIAGGIGLRTQSITIMRDALYRMCEAYNNKVLGDVMVATLLARSQDLTAVILAVEQLTGAVAANQVSLTGTAGANASANLVANDQALAAAQNNVTKRMEAFDEATTKLAEAETALSTARTNEEAAKAALKAAKEKNPQVAGEITTAESMHKRAQETLQNAEEELKRVKTDLKTKESQLENAKQVVETIQAAMDAALTNAAANTSGSGQFSTVQPRNVLSDNATKEIAEAVQYMVLKVLDKSYADESCMALLTSDKIIQQLGDNGTPEANKHLRRVQDHCLKLLSKGIAKALVGVSKYGPDDNSEILENAISDDQNLDGQLNNWLKTKGHNLGTTELIYGNYPGLRVEAIKKFKIKPKSEGKGKGEDQGEGKGEDQGEGEDQGKGEDQGEGKGEGEDQGKGEGEGKGENQDKGKG